MPHVFQGTVPHLPVALKSFELLADFLSAAFGDRDKLKLGEFIIHPITLEERIHDRDGLTLGGLEPEVLLEKMEQEVEHWKRNDSIKSRSKEWKWGGDSLKVMSLELEFAKL